MCVYCVQDFGVFVGNVPKLMISFISMVINLIYLTQRFILFGPPKEPAPASSDVKPLVGVQTTSDAEGQQEAADADGDADVEVNNTAHVQELPLPASDRTGLVA